MSAIIEVVTKSREMTIVALNNIFSPPRLVLYPKPESAPKAPPRPAPRCCSKILAVIKTARVICTYGKTETSTPIGEDISTSK